MRAGNAPRGFILREDAVCADNYEGQPIMPWDVLPGKGPWRGRIAPLYVAWLLCYLDELREHGWPDMPYNDNRTDHSGIPQDPIQAAMVFVAEITTRVDRCGRDGRLATGYYRDAETLGQLAKDCGLPVERYRDQANSEEKTCKRIKSAVLYCAGRRKMRSYHDWKGRNWHETKQITQLDRPCTNGL